MTPEHIVISTNALQAESIRFQLVEWKDALQHNFLLEPEGRNTAPAIALAASHVMQHDPDGVMLVLPADHVIKEDARFRAAVSLATRLADDGYLVTFGVKPIRPETGYGYIQPNRRVRLGQARTLVGHPVARFVEKPDAPTAQALSPLGELLLEQRHVCLARLGHFRRAGSASTCPLARRTGLGLHDEAERCVRRVHARL